jgi:hypothetical protein
MGQLLNWSLRWLSAFRNYFFCGESTADFSLPPWLTFNQGRILNHCPKVHCTKGQVCGTVRNGGTRVSQGPSWPAAKRFCIHRGTATILTEIKGQQCLGWASPPGGNFAGIFEGDQDASPVMELISQRDHGRIDLTARRGKCLALFMWSTTMLRFEGRSSVG